MRNVETADAAANGRAAGVLLVTEAPIVDGMPGDVAKGCPHLAEADHGRLSERYLGQTTWSALAKRLGVGALPKTTTEAAVRLGWLAPGE